MDNNNTDDIEGWKKYLPAGVKFRPTDKELTVYYLYRKVLGKRIRPGIISEIDIYNYEPPQLKGLAFDHGDEKMYFFSKIQKKYKAGNRIRRELKSKTGFWRATQARKDIKDASNNNNPRIYGTKTPLAFYYYNAAAAAAGGGGGRGGGGRVQVVHVKTNWLMAEFRTPDNASSSQQQQYEWTLCVVYQYKAQTKNDSNPELGQDVEEGDNTNTNATTSTATATATMDTELFNYQQELENILLNRDQNPSNYSQFSTGNVYGLNSDFNNGSEPTNYCFPRPISVPIPSPVMAMPGAQGYNNINNYYYNYNNNNATAMEDISILIPDNPSSSSPSKLEPISVSNCHDFSTVASSSSLSSPLKDHLSSPLKDP